MSKLPVILALLNRVEPSTSSDPDIIMFSDSLSEVITPLAILAEVMAESSILSEVMAESEMSAVTIVPLAILAEVIAESEMSVVTIAPLAI